MSVPHAKQLVGDKSYSPSARFSKPKTPFALFWAAKLKHWALLTVL